MFEYLRYRQKFVIALGQYISHRVVTYFDGKRHHRSVAELNALDRVSLARDFYENVIHSSLLEGERIPNQDMLDDIALYIDQRIPQAYYKWNGWKDGAPSTHVVDVSEFGLIYHFPRP